MSVFITKNALNEKLISSVNTTIDAYDRKRTIFVWLKRFLGIGLFFMLIGAAAGISIYAYSRFNGVISTEDLLTKSFIDALKNVKLRSDATGSVLVKSDPLKFSSDQLVKLDPNSVVKLDPSASIKVESEVVVAIPFDYLNINKTTTGQKPTLSNPQNTFVVFKSISYGKGKIYTGWNYQSSNQSKPDSEFCYYSEASTFNEVSADFFFAKNGQLSSNTKPPENFDTVDAIKYCFWFKG